MANSSGGKVAKQRVGSRGVWLTQLAREQLELQVAIILANATSLDAIQPGLIADDEIRELADLVLSFPHLARLSVLDLACFVQSDPELIAFIEWLTAAPVSFRERVRPMSVLTIALGALNRSKTDADWTAKSGNRSDVWASVLRAHRATADKRRGNP